MVIREGRKGIKRLVARLLNDYLFFYLFLFRACVYVDWISKKRTEVGGHSKMMQKLEGEKEQSDSKR